MEILQQIGQLVLGSIPTMVLFLLLLLCYRILVHAPLIRLLAQRREQTEGAMEKAKEAIAAAEAKTAAYEEQLRAARKSAQAAREGRLQQWNLEQENALIAVRQTAQERVHQERIEIEKSTEESRQAIEAASHQLAAQIVAHLLSPSGTQPERAH